MMEELSPVSGDQLASLFARAIDRLRPADVDHAAAFKALITFLKERSAGAPVVDLGLSDFRQAGSKWSEDTFVARVSGLNAFLKELWKEERAGTAEAALRPAAVEIEGAPHAHPQYRFVWVDADGNLRRLRVPRNPAGYAPLPISIAEGEILRGFRSVVECNIAIVNEATDLLIATGSRSRDRTYLDAIERRLQTVPQLVHYRVLFGPPHKQVLKEHLQRLLEIRSPTDRSQGQQTLFVSMFNSCYDQQEFCLCINEYRAQLVLPGLGGVKHYDSGLVVKDPDILQCWQNWAKELYWAPRRKGTTGDVRGGEGTSTASRIKFQSMQDITNDHEWREVCESIAAFAAELVRLPSRAGEDSVAPVVGCVKSWLYGRGLPAEVLTSGESIVGLYSRVSSGAHGRSLCLDACLDTAPFGDESNWSVPPTSGAIRDRHLYGRGAADSKIAVSLFCHLAAELARSAAIRRGNLFLLFDADEHTGGFAGVKSFLNNAGVRPDAMVVGYPGNYGVVFGARGFFRARMTVFGVSEHSGSKRPARANAVVRAARLVELLSAKQLPKDPTGWFDFGPRVTVTALHGGDSFSQVPDQCTCNVDIRLTPSFDQRAAQRWLEDAAVELDHDASGARTTEMIAEESWPAYRLGEDEPIVRHLREAASEVFRRAVKPVVCGPSNIGNYLAAKGIAAVCGFGASYQNIHAADECVDLETLPMVYETYRRAVIGYLSEE